MTHVETTAGTCTRLHTVDIAGTSWPVYKLEALAVGVLVFLGALALTTSLQLAVLVSACATVLAWWSLRLAEAVSLPSSQDRTVPSSHPSTPTSG
ncbi:hypothetical protein E5720_19825 [Rhodococcus sp. PAMC28707]|uniref:hypothetical protein n=1 Tax=unclassified Rhodococcus (in: high G+C Gram-positive bacteria) TaxID=192944 RepID=UPI00109E1FEE|nr:MULTISPECIES: hypothetical protein [unclassified Rhodococcus (in: high G+C Gram-positive bacteria)]QCB51447.1 hypothetical protein E5769_15700 [Rhodococcus sp. PAMC28705]QCB60385.1 hypothetical protein E5720_19825 [Rhodococcus sp. PAMC28707]